MPNVLARAVRKIPSSLHEMPVDLAGGLPAPGQNQPVWNGFAGVPAAVGLAGVPVQDVVASAVVLMALATFGRRTEGLEPVGIVVLTWRRDS